MLIESALCLVLDLDKLPHGEAGTGEGSKRGGVLTPAAAFGEVLMERLEKASNLKFCLKVAVELADKMRNGGIEEITEIGKDYSRKRRRETLHNQRRPRR